jgi:WD40 repeat protein
MRESNKQNSVKNNLCCADLAEPVIPGSPRHSLGTSIMAFAFVLLLTVSSTTSAQTMTGSEAETNLEKVSFDAVQPILRKHCERCHNEDQPRGDLVLTSLDKVLAGSSSGFVVVAGKVEESPLYLLTAHLDTPKMPPNKPRIPQRELNIIEKWITTGLVEESQASSKGSLEKSPSPQTKVPITELSKKSVSASESESKSSGKDAKVFGPLVAIPQPTPVRAMASHPTEPVVVVSGLHQVAILNTTTSQFESQAIEVGERDISALRFSADGKLLLIAAGMIGESGTVLVLDWQTKQWLPSFGDEPDNIQSLDCNSDASQVAIGTATRLVKLFDRATQKELFVERKHTDWVLAIAYSRDGFLLASGDRFGGIHVWETDTGKEFAALRGHAGGITGLVWSPDGNELISSSLDGTVRVWNMHSLQVEKSWQAHERGVLSLVVDSQKNLLTSGRDGWIRKWAAENSKPCWQSKLPDEAIAVCSLAAGQSAVIGADAVGGIYRLSTVSTEANELASTTFISLPSSQHNRSFASVTPTAPIRTALKPSVVSDVRVAPGRSDPRSGTFTESAFSQSLSSDLEESRRTLASVEHSLEQTYRTAEQLEESVARLKQLIALQEARMKQMELQQKPNRSK